MRIKDYIPGSTVVLVIALFSTYLSSLHASFDSLVISILLGMFSGNLMGSWNRMKSGVERAIKVFLPAGIALYGTQLVLKGLQGGQLLGVFLVFSSLFGLTLLLSRAMNFNRHISLLLASGLSVCGASAIAIISPLIGARREDTSTAIISVMMLGLTGMIFYPIFFDLLSLSIEEYNFLVGTTLPMLGQVKVTAGIVCPECLETALRIKLVRISFLLFLVPAIVFNVKPKDSGTDLPWFMVAFACLAILVNLITVPREVVKFLGHVSNFCLSAGLAAIGFTVEFDSIIEEGLTPLGIIFLAWSVVFVFIYIARNIINV